MSKDPSWLAFPTAFATVNGDHGRNTVPAKNCVLCHSSDVTLGHLCHACIAKRKAVSSKRYPGDLCLGQCGRRLLDWYAYCGSCLPTRTTRADDELDFDPI